MSSSHANRRALRLDKAQCDTASSFDPASEPSNDIALLEATYRSEAPGLARYFRMRLRPGEEVADLVQETFARLAALMARRPLPRVGPYLNLIACNLLKDRSKRLEARLASLHVPIGETNEPAVAPDQEQLIEAKDLMRIYEQALGELPARTREIFLLHRVEELPYREIGAKLAISVPTVQYHIGRALAHIDAALERG